MRAQLLRGLKERSERAGWLAVEHGVPPSWLGYRFVPRQTVHEYFARHGGDLPRARYETIHPTAISTSPLPCNVRSREELPVDRGWWGFSFRDVPERVGGETFIATLPDCRIVWYRDPARANDFYPAILNADGRGLDMRELRFRPLHAEVLRRSHSHVRLDKATWITERVYHNHSHWLTAHLPKILLLRERKALADVLLPPERTPAIDGSLRALGLDPHAFASFDLSRPLEVGELTVIGTDRFRPELLQLVSRAFGAAHAPEPWRRVFISRARATRRRLLREDAIWKLFEREGFERVHMEELPFERQLSLMRETAVLAAPHGAGLTNMVFCPPNAHILEIADLGFPNPNFYALASALRHHYWVVAGRGVGEGRPIDRDIEVDPAAVAAALGALTEASPEHVRARGRR